MIFMSKRDTPLVEADATAILGMSAEAYRAAVAERRLGLSIRLANDPTNRLAFHSFWDLVEFSLAGGAGGCAAEDEARRLLAAELSDHLAQGTEDLVAGTGDEGADLATVSHEWAEQTELDALPMGVVRCYARLLLRTLRHVHAAAVEAGGGACASVPAQEGVPTWGLVEPCVGKLAA